jgi:hypothetical protein
MKNTELLQLKKQFDSILNVLVLLVVKKHDIAFDSYYYFINIRREIINNKDTVRTYSALFSSHRGQKASKSAKKR